MKNTKGYTLSELLAVIVLIALISTMALTAVAQKSKTLRDMSQAQFEKLIISSAKSYVEDHRSLKDKAKFGENVKITYTTLKNAKLIPDTMRDLTTFENKPIDSYSVCLKYVDYKYNYTITTSENCD